MENEMGGGEVAGRGKGTVVQAGGREEQAKGGEAYAPEPPSVPPPRFSTDESPVSRLRKYADPDAPCIFSGFREEEGRTDCAPPSEGVTSGGSGSGFSLSGEQWRNLGGAGRTHRVSRIKLLKDQLRRANDELRKMNEQLEQRVQERTQELTAAVHALESEVIERQKTEEALRKSEERYALAVLGANDGIWDRDIASGSVYFSPRWKSMLGYEEHEISNTYREWRDRLHPDDRERVIRHMKEYLEGEASQYELECRLLHRDGTYRWILTRGACFRDERGKAYRVAGSHTDITSRKLAEQALKNNQALLAAVLENLPVGVWVVDESGSVIMGNSAAYEIWGGSPADFEADRGARGCTDALLPGQWVSMQEVMRGNSSLGEILEIETLDLRRKTVSRSAVPIRNSGGEIVGAIAVVEDITERKSTEDALRRSEQKYRKLFEESRDGIYIMTGGGVLLDANPAFCELFGYSRNDLFSLDFDRDLYLNPQDAEFFRRTLFAKGFVKDFEVEMKRKDGERVTVFNSSSLIYREDGSGASYWGILHDVSEQKRLQEQLLQAQKMESVGLLAGGVAHDFNNMLTAISGYTQLIREHAPQDDMISSSTEHILKAAERAVTLTQNLLAFSRKQIINPRPVLLNEIVSRSADLCSMVVREDIEFVLDLSPQELVALADSGQIEQVLLNLVTNSCDAMPEGGRLRVSTGVVELGDMPPEGLLVHVGPGRYATITVEDTGAGMSEEIRRKIFEPFFTTKEVGKGTGLGLSIIYGIIRQHSGTLSVRSEAGAGTEITVFLPLVRKRVKELKPEEPERELPPRPGTETVLVAEDDEVVRHYIQEVLSLAGYTVIQAVDGEDAVQRFRVEGEAVDLVLTDVVMPRKNGLDAYREIAKIRPGTPVIFSSGYTADIIHKRGIMEEGLDFIAKPVSKNRLLTKVREVLDRQVIGC